MRRGDIVIVALQGDQGKPRPALIIQSDHLVTSTHVAVLALTSVMVEAPLVRVPVPATPQTGLTVQSHVMLDRMTIAPRSKIRAVIGRLDDMTMLAVNRAMMVFLGLA